MKSLFAIAGFLTAALMGCSEGPASLDAAASEPLRAVVDSIATAHLRDGGVAGFAVSIMRGDRIVFSRGYGLANIELKIPVSRNTVFRIASVTKNFTAAAVLRLADQGVIDLSQPANEYLPTDVPDFPGVSVHRLLNHTNGIPSITRLGSPYWSQIDRPVRPMDLVEMIRDRPPEFAPGTRYAYNNSGYLLLGVLIEHLTDLSYADYVERRLLTPAGLEDMFYCSKRPEYPFMTAFYSPGEDGPQPAADVHMSQGFSTGGLCATADDLATWMASVFTTPPFSDSLLIRMTTPDSLLDGTRLGYGYGLGVGWLGTHPLYFHGGSIFGADAQAVHFPQDSLTIVALANTDGAGMMRLENRISRQLLDVDDPMTIKLDSTLIERYSGLYSNEGITVQVLEGEGGLTLSGLWGEDPVALIPIGPGVFQADDHLERIRFEENASGVMTALLTHYGARILEFEQVQ